MYDADDIPVDTSDDVGLLRPVPDLGGLAVEDASGLSVGELYGSLIEAETGLVRYVDLELDTLDRHVLVPIGHARVHERDGGPRLRLRAELADPHLGHGARLAQALTGFAHLEVVAVDGRLGDRRLAAFGEDCIDAGGRVELRYARVAQQLVELLQDVGGQLLDGAGAGHLTPPAQAA